MDSTDRSKPVERPQTLDSLAETGQPSDHSLVKKIIVPGGLFLYGTHPVTTENVLDDHNKLRISLELIKGCAYMAATTGLYELFFK